MLSKKTVFEYPDRKEFLAQANPEYGEKAKKGQRVPAGLAITKDGKTLYVAAAFGHSVGRFDAESGAFQGELALEAESYPYGLALDESRKQLYVSLWSKAKVAVVNTDTFKLTASWPTEEHPNEMLLAKGGKILYVANANRNTVSVIDTEVGRSIETIGTAIDPKAPPGSTPSSLALSPDESMLFVANANTNNLAVVNVKDPGGSAPLGFIPVGWYPTSVRLARDGKTIYVTNGKGGSSRANRDGPRPGFAGRPSPTQEYIGGLFQGTLSTIPMPTPRQMTAYSQTVYECSPLRRGDPAAVSRTGPAPGNPIPAKVGEPSPIKYVIYVVKENRTYDQVFGDMKEGNGEPSICLFPEAVTPNHHALAREFVLLDNFYVESEVSADGHEWSMGAYATDFVERIWPLGYRGDRRVPYPAEGAFDEVARPAGGYLWDKAAEKGVTYRSYGEWVTNGKTAVRSRDGVGQEPSRGTSIPMFRSFDMDYPDVKRAERFLQELAGFEKAGEMPRLMHPAAAQRPHLGDNARQVDRHGLRRRQRPGAGPARRGTVEEPVLEEPGDVRGRGRRSKRFGPRRCPPHRRPGDQPVYQAPLGRFDALQHVVDAPHDGIDPGPESDVAVRRGRPADVQFVHRTARFHSLRPSPGAAST